MLVPGSRSVQTSNVNDMETKQNTALILTFFLYQSETNLAYSKILKDQSKANSAYSKLKKIEVKRPLTFLE
jgi:hypothetical protein